MSQAPPLSFELSRSISAPGAADAGIETSPSEQHSFFSPNAASNNGGVNTAGMPARAPPSRVGHSHHASLSDYPGSHVSEPMTPNDFNTAHAASSLLGNQHMAPSHLAERRNSKPNLRLQSQAPPQLSSAALAVPASTLFIPASPMTPAGFGGPPPPTPAESNIGRMEPLTGQDPVTPLFDQPFLPPPVPMSPFLPQAPPSSPFPAMSLSSSRSFGSGTSPDLSPDASPHPIRKVMQLPATMSGEDILHRSSDGNDEAPPPVPLEAPEDEDDAAAALEGDDQIDPNAVVEVELPNESSSPSAAPQKVLLHRSRLGRLSIIQKGPLLASSSSVAPTATKSAEEAQAASKKLGGSIVTHVERVFAFDPNDQESALKSVPPEWRDALKSQFGLPPNLNQSVKLANYNARIPLVLVRMHEYLKSHKLLQSQVGIFRLAPDANECARLKTLINENVNNIDNVSDISDMANCLANLIKVWFRDLPVSLFQSIPSQSISQMTSESTTINEVTNIVDTYLKEPQRSIFWWLLDLACDITLHHEVNKMVAKNVAICISPNLYRPPTIKSGGQQSAAEALAMMNTCKAYTNFLEIAIGLRESQRGQKQTSLV